MSSVNIIEELKANASQPQGFSKTMKPVKLGIIGCGVAATDLHWPALHQLGDMFRITAACNHTEAKARIFAEMVGNVPYCLDYRELLMRDDVEAVSIILPYHLNYSVTKAALESGKHVLVEKPLAAQLPEAEKMIALADRYPLVAMVAENFRYRPLFMKMKAQLERGVVGRCYLSLWNILMKLDSKYAETKWRKGNCYPGGLAVDGGVHYIAALRYLLGNITGGIAAGDSIDPSLGCIDTFSFQFTTVLGVSGVVNICYSVHGHSEDRLLLLGTKGTIVAEPNRIVVRKDDEADIIESIEVDIGYRGEYEDFYKAITTGNRPTATFLESYEDLKTMLQAVASTHDDHRLAQLGVD